MIEVVKKSSIGEYLTVDEAARAKGSTYVSTYKWILRNRIPRIKVGNTNMVRLIDLAGYNPR